jgi:hypothetical protein
VGAQTLVWGDKAVSADESSHAFDVVLCADCLFFTEAHGDLLHTVSAHHAFVAQVGGGGGPADTRRQAV